MTICLQIFEALECSSRNITSLTLPVGWNSLNNRLPICLALTDVVGAESFNFGYSVEVTFIPLMLFFICSSFI